MAATESSCPTNRFKPAHWSDPPFQMLVIPFQPIVEVFRGAVFDVRQQGAHGRWIAFCLIRRHRARGYCGCLQGACEKGFGCGSVTPVAQVDIDDLPIFIDRPKQLVPACPDLDVGLIHAPTTTDR